MVKEIPHFSESQRTFFLTEICSLLPHSVKFSSQINNVVNGSKNIDQKLHNSIGKSSISHRIALFQVLFHCVYRIRHVYFAQNYPEHVSLGPFMRVLLDDFGPCSKHETSYTITDIRKNTIRYDTRHTLISIPTYKSITFPSQRWISSLPHQRCYLSLVSCSCSITLMELKGSEWSTFTSSYS